MGYTNYPPVGIDRADGLDVRPGTITPDGSIIVRNAGDTPVVFEEYADSPQIERAEQGTWRHRFKVDKTTGLILLGSWGRGAFVTDSFDNQFRVLNANLSYQKGDFWEYAMTTEAISFDNPPDEFAVDIVEINPAIEKHPRYAFLTPHQRTVVNSCVQAATVDDKNNYSNAVDQLTADEFQTQHGVTDKFVQQAANELLSKKSIGEETFYLPGIRVVWSRYYWKPFPLSPGGYIEDPILQGGLPYYFWSTELDETNLNDTIFSQMVDLNPQLYGGAFGKTEISWLRLMDSIQFQRTWYKITRQWFGAPYSHWDGQIYTQQYSPYPPPYNPNGPQPPF